VKKPVPFGKYYLLERINVGGMAEVFRAKSFGVEGFERLVAVKRILPNIAEDRDFIKMFIDEAKIAVQLNHANIAQIFDLGVVDGAYYIALEHIHGRDLRAIFDRCRQHGEPMSIAQACFVAMKVCEGLDYAHNKRDQNNREIGLVHRDVSPQNVLVSFEGEVKLIDFGIAKAADKSAKTQAGILKGKFGYMSPEQVRGLPIDRRSDIFSCGIVLYELLTGERLFVGESDFSTLEKVRNVEILPPSTYNRKIPDELERIVLKALAKDVDERYLNAIDLHDELQAFVYTASEFYSRKDLAGWMKRTFAKEIDEETTKLESYRQLRPPAELGGRAPSVPPAPETGAAKGTKPPPHLPAAGPSGGSPPARRPTAAMAVVPPPGAAHPPPASAPPPPPAPLAAPPRPGRATQSVGAVPPPAPYRAEERPSPVRAAGSPAAGNAAGAPVKVPGAMSGDDSGLAWDDDELETQIYDNPEEEAAAKSKRGAAAVKPNGQPAMVSGEPDLSSLVSTAKGWEAPKLPPVVSGPTAPTLLGAPAPATNGSGNGAGNGVHAAGDVAAASHYSPAPFLPPPQATSAVAPSPARPNRESSAVMRLVEASEPVFDTMSSFGAGIAAPGLKRGAGMKTSTIIAIAAASLFVLGIVAVWIAIGGDKDGKSAAASSTTPTTVTPAGAAGAGTTTGATAGFDLYVTPGNVIGWRLDGQAQSIELPARANVEPGKHTIAIDAPAGFINESREVTLQPGERQRIEIKLSAIDIVGVFESDPPGAKVTLVAAGQRIEVGATPAKHKLDPAQRYEVLFEKAGYVSVSKPVQISGQPEEKIAAVLEPARVAAGAAKGKRVDRGGGPVTRPDDGPAKADGPAKLDGGSKGDGGGGGSKGEGILSLGAKPPCDIYLDGKSTGLKTPQRELKLGAGRHKVTLMNNEFGIKESFTVEIKAGEVVKQVKDFSDRLAAPAPQ